MPEIYSDICTTWATRPGALTSPAFACASCELRKHTIQSVTPLHWRIFAISAVTIRYMRRYLYRASRGALVPAAPIRAQFGAHIALLAATAFWNGWTMSKRRQAEIAPITHENKYRTKPCSMQDRSLHCADAVGEFPLLQVAYDFRTYLFVLADLRRGNLDPPVMRKAKLSGVRRAKQIAAPSKLNRQMQKAQEIRSYSRK